MPVLDGFASCGWGTQKYADFLDACVAITGRAPLAGCHLERAAQVVLKVKMDVSGSPARRFTTWKQWLAYLVMDISIFQSFCIHSPYHNQKTESYGSMNSVGSIFFQFFSSDHFLLEKKHLQVALMMHSTQLLATCAASNLHVSSLPLLV